jgi:hypothetical protein
MQLAARRASALEISRSTGAQHDVKRLQGLDWPQS